MQLTQEKNNYYNDIVMCNIICVAHNLLKCAIKHAHRVAQKKYLETCATKLKKNIRVAPL
jgi:hypothetical protein